MAQIVKKLPETQETQVQSLGQKNPLEKGMAILSSILAWRIPWTVAHQAPLCIDSTGKNTGVIPFSRGFF